jgi:sugar lactone lactonase YvrE
MKINFANAFYMQYVFVIATSIALGILMMNNPNMIFAQDITASLLNKSLEKTWETPNQLKDPESVAYDSSKAILYVSSIDGNPDGKDGNGFISKISAANGSIIDLDWVRNLNAPKGIDLDNITGKLFVSDITQLIEINSSDGKIINRYPAQENSSLNDVAVNKRGDVFVSDPPNNSIYMLASNSTGNNTKSMQIWLKSKELNGPNGIMFDYGKNHLVVASMGKGTPEAGGTIKAVDLNSKSIANIGKMGDLAPIGILDGLQKSGDGKSYYVSDWAADNVHVVDISGNGYHSLFSTPLHGIADFRVVIAGPDAENLVIPLMPANKVISLRVGTN